MEGRNLSQHRNILVNFAMFLYYLEKKKTFYELEQWLAACLSFLKMNPLLCLPSEEPSRCPVQKKVHWTLKSVSLDGSWTVWIFTHFSAHTSNPSPRLAALLRLASGLRQICGEFLWTPLLLFLIKFDDTLLVFFCPIILVGKGLFLICCGSL